MDGSRLCYLEVIVMTGSLVLLAAIGVILLVPVLAASLRPEWLVSIRSATAELLSRPTGGFVLRLAAIVFLLVHGAIHLLGVITALNQDGSQSLGGPTFLFADAGAGSVIFGVLGLLWLIALMAFVAAAVAVAIRSAGILPLSVIAATASIGATIIWFDQAWIGLVASVVVLGAAIVAWLADKAIARAPEPAF